MQLRRTASHWVATSDLLVMDQLAANQPGGFVLPAPASGAAVRALYVQDNQSIAHLLSSYLPLVRASFPQAGTKAMAPVFAAVQRLLGAATPYLKASSAGLTQGSEGTLIMGENLELILVPLSLLGAYSIPVVIQSHDLARRKQTSTRIQTLLAGLHTTDGTAPDTLAALAANAQLPANLLVSPDDPSAALPHFRRLSTGDRRESRLQPWPWCGRRLRRWPCRVAASTQGPAPLGRSGTPGPAAEDADRWPHARRLVGDLR